MDTPILNKVNVIKVGGAVVEDEQMLSALLEGFAALEGAKVLVHGGGRSATKMAAALGIETRMVEGRRVTDDEMLRVVQMVYGGLVNKTLVARLQALGVNAVGLTGADMNIIRAHKRAPKLVRFEDGHEETVDYGWVGDVDSADGEALALLLRHEPSVIPVVAPLTHDGKGHMLNTNADTMAAETAKALTPHFEVTLTYCFEKPGVLRDADDDTSVIREINEASFARLKSDGIVSGGMLPKLENAFASLRGGVSEVVITHWSDLRHERGTVIRL